MTTPQELHGDIDRLGETALRIKSERDQLVAAIRKYFDAGSERSEYAAREAMRDAVEQATGVRP